MNIGRLAEDNLKRFDEYEFMHFEGRWHSNSEINQAINQLGNGLRNME